MSKWFSPGQTRKRVTVIKVSDEGILASEGEGGILYRVSSNGFRQLVDGEADSDGMPTNTWIRCRDQNLIPKLGVGSELLMIELGTEEMRCQLNNCESCGNTECREFKGSDGPGKFAPVFHVITRWTLP